MCHPATARTPATSRRCWRAPWQGGGALTSPPSSSLPPPLPTRSLLAGLMQPRARLPHSGIDGASAFPASRRRCYQRRSLRRRRLHPFPTARHVQARRPLRVVASAMRQNARQAYRGRGRSRRRRQHRGRRRRPMRLRSQTAPRVDCRGDDGGPMAPLPHRRGIEQGVLVHDGCAWGSTARSRQTAPRTRGKRGPWQGNDAIAP